MLLEALQQLELTAEVVVVVARCEILVHPLASQLRVEWVDEDRWLCAAAHHHRLELSHLSSRRATRQRGARRCLGRQAANKWRIKIKEIMGSNPGAALTDAPDRNDDPW